MVSKRFLTLVLLLFSGSIIFNFSHIREKHLTLKELCDISEDIVVVNTLDVNSTFNQSSGRITMNISFRIKEKIKTNNFKHKQEFNLVYPGGEYGNIIQIIPGAPTFIDNENTILFLKKRNAGKKTFYYIVGTSEGKFDIDSKKNYIIRNSGDELLQKDVKNKGDIVDFSSTKKILKKDFIELIKKYL